MIQTPHDPIQPTPAAHEAERRRRMAGRNRVMGLILAALAVLFFAITIVRIGDY